MRTLEVANSGGRMEHEHDWRVIAEENEPRAIVRLWICTRCDEVMYGGALR